MGISVHALFHYPVKGCAAVPVESAAVGDMGLEHDRTFMIVDAADGGFRSQRKLPAMAVVEARVADGGAALLLSAPGAESLRVDVVPDGHRRPVSMFDRPVGEGVDQGEAAARWISEVLGADSRLVRVPPDFDRDGWGETPGKVAYADAHAVLVTSLASLDGLNARIAERGAAPVPMDRFRPNIVLAGHDEPHFEDRVRAMSIGTVDLAYSVRATRCNVPLVDQATGRTVGPEPVRTLATYRREPEFGNKVTFGVKAAVVRHGTLSVGDAVHVSAWES
ncbi:MOSC domain-containing protein [Streptomyces sp. URMC 123]|uniref:MOSC domain-containing protein n=1 Tax=Streptomyces sp. URMC 123 TaxID=3423403 RepID=UPI003F1D8129